MEAIGNYWRIVAGGENPLYAPMRFYGRRRIFLASVKRTVLQIRVYALGGLVWINVNGADLAPL